MNHIETARVKSFIEVKFTRGMGIDGDVCRIVTAIFDLKGNLIAENDPVPTTIKPMEYHKLLSEKEILDKTVDYLVTEQYKTALDALRKEQRP